MKFFSYRECFVLLVFVALLGPSSCSTKKHDVSKKATETEQDQLDKNIFIKTQDSVENQQTVIEHKVDYNPIDVVNKILANPSRQLNIALVVPTDGKYASIGTAITEAAMLTTSESVYYNSGTIKTYNIGQLNEANWQQNPEVERLLKDHNDVIIGSVFKNTTEKLLSVVPEDVPYISFINDEKLSKEHPNLTTVSINDGFKIATLLQYLQDHKRQFVSLVFPATKKGYAEEKIFRKLASDYQIFIVSSQFYQVGSKASMNASVRNLNKSFTATYMVDDNGNFSTETYKQNKERKKKNQSLAEESTTIVKTQEVETNAIYIGANENDLTQILGVLNQLGILNKNVEIFSNAVVDPEHSINTFLDQVMYIGYNYNFIDTFNKRFSGYFKHEPNYFAYMTYDVVAMLLYVANVGHMLPKNFYSEDGFRGTLDEFRFTREGNVERRFGIYKLRNGIFSKEFVSDDYIPLWKANAQKESLYIKNA